MKKRLLSIITALALCLSLLPTAALAVEDGVKYLDENGAEQTCDSATKVTSEDTTWTAGWYVVQGTVAIGSRITVTGNVHLILADGCTLTVTGGIQVQDNSTESTPNTNALTIYAQTQPVLDADGNVTNNVGKLIAQNAGVNAAIGGNSHTYKGYSGGSITINGGIVTATSSGYGAGIGGGYGVTYGGSGGKITINGGTVTATATGTYSGAGIGGGYSSNYGGSGGKITINGGTVTATGGHGAGGIGGGLGSASGGSGGTIAINGGTVTANGGTDAAGIGGGYNGIGGNIAINGGTIEANGSGSGSGIGGGAGGSGGNITISGGEVNAKGGTYGAGIGGGEGGSGGTIAINGGTVTATGGYGAGIGGGEGGSGGNITISGGTVTATKTSGPGFGIGKGSHGSNNGSFSTGVNGNAVIYASSIADKSMQGSWSGIIFEGNEGKVHGNPTLTGDLTIPEGKNLTIPEGVTLTIPAGVTLTNSGTLYVDGTLSGTVSGTVYYPLILTNCTGGQNTSTVSGKTYGKKGASVTLTATLTENQLVTGWNVTGATGSSSGSSYTISSMPANPVTATANLVDALTIDTQPTGGAITYGKTTTLSVAVSKHDNAEGTLAYKWYEGSTAIDGADSASYTTPADLVVGDRTYHCVITCGTYTVTSSTATVTVNPLAEATPIISIDYENESLTGFVSGRNYAIDGTAVITVDGKLSVVDYIDSNISIVTKASDSNHADSTAQSLAIPARPAAPAAPTVKSKTSGSVTLEEIPGAQYSMDGGATWQDSPEFTGLSASTEYSFVARYGATESSFASPISAELNVTTSAVSSGGGSSTPTYPPTVTQPENGSVTVSPKSPRKGVTVTITPTPDAGYTVEQVLVTDKNGDPVEVINNGDGTYSFTQPAGKVNINVTFMEDNSMLNFFVDVFPGDYYYDAVLWAAENGITGGVDDTHFSPNAPCTRAQIVTFLWRAAGCPEPESLTSLSDVPADAYYAKAVAWALENGITTGTGDGTTFSPNATCTRAQAMAFIYRSEQARGGGMQGAWMFLNPFDDVNLESYYGEAVMWAVANGVTDGTTATTFSPNANCTRAQIVTFLYRFFVK